MNLIHKLEKPLGWMAVEHIPIYVVTAQALVFIWGMMNPEGLRMLTMDPAAIRLGHEYWRFLTFLFVSPFGTYWLWTVLYLYFQYICGMALENEWGSFPLTMFYVIGGLGAIAAAFLWGGDIQGAFYFNDTIFLAFAALYPNFTILLFFILPVKVKWLALFVWLRILLGLWNMPLLYQAAVLLSLSNYFIFFGKRHIDDVGAAVRRWRHRSKYGDWNQ